MTMNIIQAFEQIIEPDYGLKKSGNMFEIEETAANSTNKFLKIGGCQGFGFSLDKPGGHPWKFISNSPLAGMVSVCDGIIILKYERVNYILAIDLKSKKADSKAFKQISSGFLLCQWLYELLKLHNHITEQFEFIGVVCKSRGSVAKRATKKGLNAEVDRTKSIPLVTISNPGTIHIKELIELL